MPSYGSQPSRFILLPGLAVVWACAAPLQNGGVDTAPGAADRLGYLCRIRQADQLCFSDDADEHPEFVDAVLDAGVEDAGSAPLR